MGRWGDGESPLVRGSSFCRFAFGLRFGSLDCAAIVGGAPRVRFVGAVVLAMVVGEDPTVRFVGPIDRATLVGEAPGVRFVGRGAFWFGEFVLSVGPDPSLRSG